MKLRAIIFLAVIAFASSGCSPYDSAKVVLKAAFRDARLESVRDVRHRDGGLREQVDEVFFRADPAELRQALATAGFVRDDAVPEQLRGSGTHFKELAANADQSTALGYRRPDLTPKEGKDCRLLCAEDLSWAYVIYIDYGKS